MTIEEAINISKTKNPLAKSSTKAAQQMLLGNEIVQYAVNANVSLIPVTGSLNALKTLSIKNKINGVVVITDRRIFFCSNIVGKKNSKEIQLDKIESIDDTSNALFGTGQLRIKGITDMLIIDCKIKNIKEMKEHLNNLMNNTLNQSDVSIADEIKKFKDLLDVGAITQEEFDIKKKELLSKT